MDASAIQIAPLLAVTGGAAAGYAADRAACALTQTAPTRRSAAIATVVGAVAWGAAASRWMVPDVFAAAVFLWLLLVMADTDIRGFVLPDALTMPFAALGLLHQAGRGQAESAVFGLWVGAGALAVVLVVATAVFRREVLGWGDVKLGAGLGAWLGYPMVIPGIGLGFILGAVAAVGVMIVGIVRRQWRWGRVYLPFGPFLAVAAVVVVWG